MEVYSRSQIQVETKAHVPIEYVPQENLVTPIKEKMESLSLPGCISRVSEEARTENPEQYLPMIVSIGPFHYGNCRLKAMEDQKWCYLNTLLSRNPNSNIDAVLDNCVKQLKCLEGKARKFYSGKVDLTSDEFVQMMLVDGCFIIELFLKSAIKGLKRRDDPFFSPDKFFRLTLDLILLENQIPFFIIEKLFYLVPVPKQCSSHSPPQLALRFFRKLIPGGGDIPPERIVANYHHLLDLIRQFYLPTYPELQIKSKQTNLKNAAKIQAAGIKFKKGVAENLLNIKFDDGVLKIPPLRTTTYAETLFRNLIALERCCSQYTKHITSYAFLMRCLIGSKNDVKLLQSRGILIIAPGRRREILDLFKKLDVDENLTDFCYTEVCTKINNYPGKKLFQLTLPCRKMMAKLLKAEK